MCRQPLLATVSIRAQLAQLVDTSYLQQQNQQVLQEILQQFMIIEEQTIPQSAVQHKTQMMMQTVCATAGNHKLVQLISHMEFHTSMPQVVLATTTYALLTHI